VIAGQSDIERHRDREAGIRILEVDLDHCLQVASTLQALPTCTNPTQKSSPKNAANTSARLPKSANVGSKPPRLRPALPNRSYVARRSGSDSTSNASPTSLNLCSASEAFETSG
jgi:hypothetical protein